MTHAVAGGATAVTAKVRYDIEKDWDYGYLEALGRDELSRRSTPTCRRTPTRTARTSAKASPAPRPARGWTSPPRCPAGHHRDAVPLLDRRRRGGGRAADRRHHPGRSGDRHGRDGRRGLDLRRVRPGEAAGGGAVLQRLHRREPSVRRVRLVARDGVQLRVPRDGPGQLGGDPPVHARPARHLLGRQLEDNNVGEHPGQRPDPAGGRPPAVLALAGRHADAQPDPVLRLDVRAAPRPRP